MAVRLEHIQEWIASTVNTRMDGDLLTLLKDGQILCKLANSLNASIRINKLKTTFHSKENITAFLHWAHRMEVPEQDMFTADDLLWGKDVSIVLRTLSALYNMFAEEIRASIQYTPSMCQSQASYRSNSVVSDGWSSDDSGLGDLHDDSADEEVTDIAESIFVRANRSSSKFDAFMNQIPLANSPPKSKMAAFLAKTPVTAPVVIPAPSSRKQSVDSNRPPSRRQSVESRTDRRPSIADAPPSPIHYHMSKPRGPPKSCARSPIRANASTPPPPQPKAPELVASKPGLLPKSADPRANLAKLLMQNAPVKARVPDDDDDMMTPPSSPKVHTSLQTPKSTTPPVVEQVKPAPISLTPASVPSTAKTVTTAMPTPAAPAVPKLTPIALKPTPISTPPKEAPIPKATPLPAAQVAAKPVNKLAGFLAKVPSTAPAAAPSAAPVSKLMAFMSSTSSTSFNPSKLRPPSTVPTMAQPVKKSKPVFRCARSTGSFNWVRERRTYAPSHRPKFDKEGKRQKFMALQAAIKAEQKAAAAHAKKGKNTPACVPGMLCYIPDEAETWVLAEIESVDTRRKHVRVKLAHDTSNRTIDLKDADVIRAIGGTQATEIDALPLAIAHHEGVEDMRNLRFLNEPSILYNLKSRFEAAKPYTYTNEIVIAVNPYQWLGALYADQLHEKYLHQPKESLPPHVYATSTRAYKQMMQPLDKIRNQSILVSGESGAGKTETTKILMHHLATIAGGRQDATIARVIDVNPLLESFGNAKTLRNDNSSRFGKFTQLQFDRQGRLEGGRCETYLLEKSRVVSFADGERNYHIFYQLLSGLSCADQAKLHLDPAHAYHYTGYLKDMQIDGMDDAAWLKKTEKALGLIHMDGPLQWHDWIAVGSDSLGFLSRTLYSVLAGILHLGEITFTATSDTTSAVAKGNNTLALVSELLGLPTATIEFAFCNRTIASNRESVTVPLNAVEAAENRDALAKAIYANLFDFLVQRINTAIAVELAATQIGVLDIFGFEDFKHNGFEQFCINYANEKLQQKFVKDVFSSVQDEYVREGLAWDHIQYADNQDILNLIEGKLGIINLMNDHLRQPRGTEEALVNKFRTNAKDSPVIAFAKVKRTQFTIKHYAGAVTYETIGFMEKHRDALMPDLLTLVQASSVSFVVDLFPNPEDEEMSNSGTSASAGEVIPPIIQAWNLRRKGGATVTKSKDEEVVEKSFGARRKAVPPKTLGQQFKTSLSKLMETIEATHVHYVRCIKPNAVKSPTEFDKPMVVAQLRSAGVIDAIRISRAGYPSRLSAHELATRYSLMFPPSMVQPTNVQETCAKVLAKMGFHMPVEYQMGKTLVYFKAGVLEELETLKSDFEYEQATIIQKIVLGFLARRRLDRKLRAAVTLQAFGRRVLEQNFLHNMRHRIVSVQVAFRHRKLHKQFVAKRAAAEAAALAEAQAQAAARQARQEEAQLAMQNRKQLVLPPKLDDTNWVDTSPRSSHSTPLTSPEAATSEESFGCALTRAKQAESDAKHLMQRSDSMLAANKSFEAEAIRLREQVDLLTKENERLRQLLKDHRIHPETGASTSSSGKWL
ncbi:hypothetical protein DYB32_000892 [Aphanomyces invadans]|uniref:Myosin motor domain-containing protein n=1 Tax=Aphanomyces invadans TaxID=157072 RepID=A0A3R6WT60_9STRA|nr:hypothetical protein DYB32_000892 [Aphanomyces invadans]